MTRPNTPPGQGDVGEAGTAGQSVPTSLRSRRFLAFCPEAVFLLVTTASGIWGRGRWVNPFGDTGYSWSAVHRVSQGQTPYRDFFFSYTPLSVELLGSVARIFGQTSRFWLLANWIPAAICGLLLLAAARRILGPIEQLAVIPVFLALSFFVPGAGRLMFPYYPGAVHATMFSLAALLCLGTPETLSWRRGLLAGAFAGLAFSCKQEIGVAAFVGIMSPAFIQPSRAIRWCAAAVGGTVAAAALAMSLVMPLPSLSSLVNDNRLWPLAFRPPPELSPLFRSVAGMSQPGWAAAVADSALRLLLYCVILLFAPVLLAGPRRLRDWLPLLVPAVVLFGLWLWEGEGPAIPSSPVCLSVLVSVAVGAVALFRKSLPGRTFIFGFGVFAAMAGLRTLFSPVTTLAFDGPARVAASLTWAFFLTGLLPLFLLPNGRAQRLGRWLMATVLFVVAVPPSVEGIRSLRFDDRRAFPTRQGVVFVDPPQAAIMSVLARALVPGERTLLLPASNATDALFGVQNLSPLIDLTPGWVDARVDRELTARFDRETLDAVVLFDRPAPEFKIAPFGRGYGVEIVRLIGRRYRVVDACPGVRVLRPLPPYDLRPDYTEESWAPATEAATPPPL